MLTAEHITYSYSKRTQVLQDVTLRLEPGLTILIGENGSGKTTLIKALTGILPADGNIKIDGVSQKEKAYYRYLAYLPQTFDVYPSFKVRDILRFIAALKGIEAKQIPVQIDRVAEKANVATYLDRKFKKCSDGMKRRVGIAATLLGDAKVIILDEPTAGIDPKERIQFYKAIKECFAEKTVLLSTHILDDMESLADHVVMLTAGHISYAGSYQAFGHSLDDKLYACTCPAKDFLKAEAQYTVLSHESRGEQVVCTVVAEDMPKEPFTDSQKIQPTTEELWLYYQKAAGETNG